MVLRLGEALGVTLRERNQLLQAAGLPPGYPQADLNGYDLTPYQVIPTRRERTCPRAVKRARHNSYRVKKRDEPASIRHPGPATIHIYKLQPRAA